MLRVDAEKYPEAIQKEVTHIFRIKAKGYSSKKQEVKEYVYLWENSYGKNWLGQTVPPVSNHIEGKYFEKESEPVVQQQKIIGYKRSGQHEVQYIPFSMKAVDDIIARSTMDNKHEIKFYVKFPDGLRCGSYSYDQFVTMPIEECYSALRTDGGPRQYQWNIEQQKKKDAEILKQQKQYS